MPVSQITFWESLYFSQIKDGLNLESSECIVGRYSHRLSLEIWRWIATFIHLGLLNGTPWSMWGSRGPPYLRDLLCDVRRAVLHLGGTEQLHLGSWRRATFGALAGWSPTLLKVWVRHGALSAYKVIGKTPLYSYLGQRHPKQSLFWQFFVLFSFTF